MKLKTKTTVLEKACSKIEAIIEIIPNTSDRTRINAAVEDVVADLERALLEIKISLDR